MRRWWSLERSATGGLEIQRGLAFDRQDVALGQDTYCLVRDGAVTHYGGIAAWSLDSDGLTLQLADEAARELGLTTVLQVTLDEEGQALVRDHLARLLS
jgi:hypothetical protein